MRVRFRQHDQQPIDSNRTNVEIELRTRRKRSATMIVVVIERSGGAVGGSGGAGRVVALYVVPGAVEAVAGVVDVGRERRRLQRELIVRAGIDDDRVRVRFGVSSTT